MTSSNQTRDRIFAELMLPGDFVFDEKVANVFEDMINRSVPGYSTIIAMIGVLAERYYQENTTIYDLGCSLGGATFAAAYQVSCSDYSIVAVDNSPAMIDKLQHRLATEPGQRDHIQCRCEDISATEISNASVIVLNFSLQFIPLAQRHQLLEKIFQGLNPGGILIISEKILFPDDSLNRLFSDLYHNFKESRGYSQLEISQKRAALENILIPETLNTHRSRLATIGFRSFDVWFQCFNFASMVAFR